MDGAIAGGAGIISGGEAVADTITVGAIIAISGDLKLISFKRPLSSGLFLEGGDHETREEILRRKLSIDLMSDGRPVSKRGC
jgi:hypothetical protein